MEIKLTFITKDKGKTWKLEKLPGTPFDEILTLMATTQLPLPDDKRFNESNKE